MSNFSKSCASFGNDMYMQSLMCPGDTYEKMTVNPLSSIVISGP